MRIDEIRTIVELMSKNDLTEFKIEAEEYNLCIRRGSNDQPIIASAPMIQAAPAPAAAPATAPAPAAAAPVVEAAAENLNTIDSPIVGTFYRSPSPEAAPFVNVGEAVTPDSVVCIVEAMKVMNEVKAEKSGVIREILLDNAQPVEFGQPLFVID